MSFQLSPQAAAPASQTARVLTKGKGVFKSIFRCGVDKEVQLNTAKCIRAECIKWVMHGKLFGPSWGPLTMTYLCITKNACYCDTIYALLVSLNS